MKILLLPMCIGLAVLPNPVELSSFIRRFWGKEEPLLPITVPTKSQTPLTEPFLFYKEGDTYHPVRDKSQLVPDRVGGGYYIGKYQNFPRKTPLYGPGPDHSPVIQEIDRMSPAGQVVVSLTYLAHVGVHEPFLFYKKGGTYHPVTDTTKLIKGDTQGTFYNGIYDQEGRKTPIYGPGPNHMPVTQYVDPMSPAGQYEVSLQYLARSGIKEYEHEV